MTTHDSLQTEAELGVALALHGLVADLLRGLQEGVEDDEEGGELALELGAPGDQLLVERQLNLNKMIKVIKSFRYLYFKYQYIGMILKLFSSVGGNFH